MLKNVLLGMSRTPAVKHAVVAFPLTRRLVERFVAGENLDDCLRVTHALVERGLLVTIDFLGEDTTTAAQADRVTDTYVELLNRLSSLSTSRPATVGSLVRRLHRCSVPLTTARK